MICDPIKIENKQFKHIAILLTKFTNKMRTFLLINSSYSPHILTKNGLSFHIKSNKKQISIYSSTYSELTKKLEIGNFKHIDLFQKQIRANKPKSSTNVSIYS